MSRPPKPPMTDLEHDLIHVPGMGLRTAAKIISRSRGAEAASATATEKAWRTVSFAWVKRQHDAIGCNKTLGATKPQAGPLAGALQQNERPMDYTGTRIAPVQQSPTIPERPSDTGGEPFTPEVESEQGAKA